jgi:CubicO group peptidase (beta-lactamase class C family)
MQPRRRVKERISRVGSLSTLTLSTTYRRVAPLLFCVATTLANGAVPAESVAETPLVELGCKILQEGDPRLAPRRFAAVDEKVAQGVGTLYAGATIVVSLNGKVVHTAAFGNAEAFSVGSDGAVHRLWHPRKMRADDIFDMASVTKVEATTAAIIHLVGEGRISLDDRLGTLLPEFNGTDKADISVRQLLTHRAGLWEWQPTWLHKDRQGTVLPYLVALPLRYPIGSRYAYSDIGFMLLGEIISRVSGTPLDVYVKREIYQPLGMVNSGYRPLASLRGRMAATSQGDRYQRGMAESGKPYPAAPFPSAQPFTGYRENYLVGEANDANSWHGWNGVAGHAGLFSTALDLSRYAQALMNAGCYGSWKLAPATTVAQFEETPFDPVQALGFHKTIVPGIAAPFFGHAGFTGTWFAFSPQLGISVVLLTNRVHRDESDGNGYPSVDALRDVILRDAIQAALSR